MDHVPGESEADSFGKRRRTGGEKTHFVEHVGKSFGVCAWPAAGGPEIRVCLPEARKGCPARCIREKNGEKIWCINAQAAYEKWERFEQARDKEVDQYQSPEDYAEAHYDDFYEDALEYEEEDVDEVMYELAMEYWQENQAQPRPSY